MKTYVRVVIVLLVVVASLVVFGNFNLTGDIVWEPVSNNNCGDAEIKAIWDSVFVEISDDVIILIEDEGDGDCEKYIAYKNNSDGELWVLSGENYNVSWGGDYRYFNNGRVLNRFNSSFVYFNATDSFIELFNETEGVDSKIDILNNVVGENLTNWSVPDTSALDNKIIELYKFSSISGENFSDGGNSFGNYSNFNELEDGDLNYSSFGVVIYKNESLSLGVYSIVIYDPDFIVEFLEDIDDYGFEINSSWNFAFNLSDHFNVSDDVSIGFGSTGLDNENGELINYTINESGIFFMPVTDFNGSLEFELVADNPSGDDIYSNLFTVTIGVPPSNSAPILIKDFEDVNMSYGDNISVVLGNYFSDPDGDSLSYVVDKVGGVNFSVVGGSLYFWLNDDFNIYAKLIVNASDGEGSVGGNWFYLYEYVSSEALTNGEEDPTLTEGETTPNENGSVNDNSAGEGDVGWVRWFVWGVIVIVILAIIMFMIWFFILRKDDSIVPNNSAVPRMGPPVNPAPAGVPVNSVVS